MGAGNRPNSGRAPGNRPVNADARRQVPLVEINRDARRVVFVLRDSWSFWRFLGVIIGTLLTLGLWSRGRGYLVIAERQGEP